MAEIVNLRQARKRRDRQVREAAADENRPPRPNQTGQDTRNERAGDRAGTARRPSSRPERGAALGRLVMICSADGAMVLPVD